MPTEIERKFLVTDRSFLDALTGKKYRQGYLPTQGRMVVRVRVADTEGYLTLKGKTDGIRRLEYEYPIPVAEAHEIMDALCGTAIVEKIRYGVVHEGQTWEVDVFLEANEGLVVAEIELEDETQEVHLPPWIGREVSHDHRYANSYLAQNPYSTW